MARLDKFGKWLMEQPSPPVVVDLNDVPVSVVLDMIRMQLDDARESLESEQ
jgi:hypothetical protein